MKRYLLVLLILIPFTASANLTGQALIDSLKKELQSDKFRSAKDTFKVKLLNNLAFKLSNKNPEEGLKYANEALKLSEEINWKKGIGVAYNSMYANYNNKSEFKTAFEYSMKSLKIFEELGDKKNMAANLGNIALYYQSIGDYVNALDYNLRGLKIAEETHNKESEAANCLNIGTLYRDLIDTISMRTYNTRALNLFIELKDPLGTAQAYANLASYYVITKKFIEAKINYEESAKMFQMVDDKYNLQTILKNLCTIYGELGENVKALSAGTNALKINEELGNKEGYAFALDVIGMTYWRIGKDSLHPIPKDSLVPKTRIACYNLATEYVERSEIILKELNSIEGLSQVHVDLSYIYESTKSWEKLVRVLRSHIAIKDTMYSSDYQTKMAMLESKQESALKNKQIEINRILESDKKKERVIYLIGTGFLLLIVIVLRRNAVMQKTTNKQLEQSLKQLAEEKQKLNEMTHSQQVLLSQQDALVSELDNAAKMKSKFLANISHELRTPVTLLTGMLELMKTKKDQGSDKEREQIQVALNNSRKLQFMIEEILDLSKLENNDTKLVTDVKQAGPLIRRMVYAFETFIEKENLTLIFNDDKAKGAYIRIDESKFEKIINNLIYNAVKFNVRGGEIKVVLTKTINDRELVLEVSDTGKGIGPADLPHIFERFYQGESGTTKAEGAGIGLSLVKEFTLLMGGSILVESTPGKGTRFTLRFPVADNIVEEATIVEESLPPILWENLPQRPTILVVEDNEDMRYYLTEVLSGNVNIATTGNGKQALDWLAKNKADLIISDLMMPEMDGREFVALLKNDPSLRRLPVITLTALADAESQLGMLRMGVDDYIVKPFNTDELRIRVFNLLSNFAERNKFNELPAEPDDINEGNKEAEEFRNKISEYVLARLKDPELSVTELASYLAMSERQLYRFAKSLTGCSPAQLIKEVRLLKAYELLLSGSITKIEDVANRVGFESAGYFSRQFLERFGKRPTEFL